MRNEELKDLFDQQAAGYDKQWAGMAPIRDALYLLLDSLFAGLPENARILCVGVGTGAELAHLAERFPGWHFTAVDPSAAMLDICRQRATEGGFLSRCSFHQGYLDTLPAEPSHHGATCFLVSQFLLEAQARIAFFHEIACRLGPGAILANADLASDVESPAYEALLRSWMTLMSSVRPTWTAASRDAARSTCGGTSNTASVPPERAIRRTIWPPWTPMRAVAPPGANGMTMRIGRVG